jgi:NAD(P)-dependent dehydrogenase (short-subunit alcohol dehydrogenase family)
VTTMRKVALSVGGARGIGFAIAERLAKGGARVFVTGRNATDVESAASRSQEARVASSRMLRTWPTSRASWRQSSARKGASMRWC